MTVNKVASLDWPLKSGYIQEPYLTYSAIHSIRKLNDKNTHLNFLSKIVNQIAVRILASCVPFIASCEALLGMVTLLPKMLIRAVQGNNAHFVKEVYRIASLASVAGLSALALPVSLLHPITVYRQSQQKSLTPNSQISANQYKPTSSSTKKMSTLSNDKKAIQPDAVTIIPNSSSTILPKKDSESLVTVDESTRHSNTSLTSISVITGMNQRRFLDHDVNSWAVVIPLEKIQKCLKALGHETMKDGYSSVVISNKRFALVKDGFTQNSHLLLTQEAIENLRKFIPSDSWLNICKTVAPYCRSVQIRPEVKTVSDQPLPKVSPLPKKDSESLVTVGASTRHSNTLLRSIGVITGMNQRRFLDHDVNSWAVVIPLEKIQKCLKALGHETMKDGYSSVVISNKRFALVKDGFTQSSHLLLTQEAIENLRKFIPSDSWLNICKTVAPYCRSVQIRPGVKTVSDQPLPKVSPVESNPKPVFEFDSSLNRALERSLTSLANIEQLPYEELSAIFDELKPYISLNVLRVDEKNLLNTPVSDGIICLESDEITDETFVKWLPLFAKLVPVIAGIQIKRCPNLSSDGIISALKDLPKTCRWRTLMLNDVKSLDLCKLEKALTRYPSIQILDIKNSTLFDDAYLETLQETYVVTCPKGNSNLFSKQEVLIKKLDTIFGENLREKDICLALTDLFEGRKASKSDVAAASTLVRFDYLKKRSISYDFMNYLAGCLRRYFPAVRSINLRGAKLSSRALSTLRQVRALTELKLPQAVITDSENWDRSFLKHLKILDTRECKGFLSLTPEEIGKLLAFAGK